MYHLLSTCFRGVLQRIIVKRLKDPRDITSFIKQQKEAALNTARGPHPDAAVTGFCDIMDAVLTTAGSCMNYINFAAVITASAHVWTAAQCRHSFKGQAGLHERLAALYRRCLQSLQPMLADLSAREIANVLWSSATFGFNPDAAVLGMVQDLTVRFLHFTNADKEPPRPNAQNCANFLWSLATMGHPAATTEVVHAVNLYMCALLRSQDKRVCPNAQDIANILWALAALKHAPPHDVVSAMLDCLVVLCQTPGSRPSSQAISNCLLACAELGLDVKPTWVRTLVKHFLQLPFSRVAYQEYTNATWSLAVMDCLDLNTFEAVLHRFTTKLLAQEAGAKPSSSTLHIASISQLYQTLVWLKPAPGSEQMVAWSSLRSRLQTLAPEPVLGKLSLPGLGDMEFALAAQGVPCRAQVLCGIYQAHAILSPNDNKAADVILMVQHPHEFVTNLPNR